MLSLDARTRTLAAALSATAGYVDAVGYLSLGGFFVSFMSGNSTRLAVSAAERSTDALKAVALIVIFVLGVVGGTVVARRSRRPQPVVIGCVAATIACAALLSVAGYIVPSGFLLAFAMGVENAAFLAVGGLPVGLTYMTGTLVKMGQQIGLIRSREDIWHWWPYALHWLALLAGAIGGALAHRGLGSGALWPAAIAAGCLALNCRRLTAQDPMPA
jgi:uncharacterized membrane protein YoaK (UPF0700 family)